jgi:2,3-bisphosphoglycerate-independent phosphoglycerate mutase
VRPRRSAAALGKVHSSLDHLDALIEVICKAGVALAIDAFLDGRDTPPSSAATYLAHVEAELAAHGRAGAIATIAANADMVGHTGVWDATVSAVETLDVALGRLEQSVLAADGILAITSDHGNAEEKIDADGNPLTAHTTNPVPFVIVSAQPVGTFTGNGKLGDVAPTLLPLIGLPVPEVMTGTNLLAPVESAQ